MINTLIEYCDRQNVKFEIRKIFKFHCDRMKPFYRVKIKGFLREKWHTNLDLGIAAQAAMTEHHQLRNQLVYEEHTFLSVDERELRSLKNPKQSGNFLAKVRMG